MAARPRRGKLRLALDRDLKALAAGPPNAIAGREALVKLARDLADRYDQGAGQDVLDELLGILDRLGVGRVPLVERADAFTAFRESMTGAD